MSTRDSPGIERPRPKRPLRLTDEAVDGVKRSAFAVGAGVLGARAIDRGLATFGVSRPVLVVSGFWRSGTTWMQECFAESLGAKTVFEPLSPMDPQRRRMLEKSFASEDALQAFVPGPGQDPAFWASLSAAARGHHGSRFTLSCRRSVWESFRTGIVVKDVRLHRNLRAVHDRLDVPVVHIRRHPCAVVASLRAANWHWSFERLSLVDLHVPDHDPGFLRACDADALSRLAAFWALNEREAAAALRRQPWARELTYEGMVRAPRQIEAVCEDLGLRVVRRAPSDRPSASIDPKTFAPVAARRSDFWKDVLTSGEIRRIDHIVSAIYPEWEPHRGG